MKTFDKRNIKLWTQLFKQWLSAKFEAIATAIANIDLSPISDDIADVKSDVADVKTAVENIDFTELAKDATVAKQGTNPNATNTAILAAFGNIDFSTLAKQGSNANATLTAVLEALSGGDAAEQVKDFFCIVKDGDTVKVVTEDGGEEVVVPVGLMDEDDVYDHLEDVAVLLGGITPEQAASITAATRAIIHGGSGSGEGGEGGSGSGSGE